MTVVIRWAAAVGLLAATSVACGIQATEVPVDAGPAPSKATCDAPATDGSNAKVYLVCGSRLEPVQRAARLPDAPGAASPRDLAAVATALLKELQQRPSPDEETAGFSSEVPPQLTLAKADPGTPDPVLRLSQPPGRLSPYALGQLVCTFADVPELGNGTSVILTGPHATSEPGRFPCTETMRQSPDSAATVSQLPRGM